MKVLYTVQQICYHKQCYIATVQRLACKWRILFLTFVSEQYGMYVRTYVLIEIMSTFAH